VLQSCEMKKTAAADVLRVDYKVRFGWRLSKNRLSQRLAHQCCMPLRQTVTDIETHIENAPCNRRFRGERLDYTVAFLMCVFMSDKPFVEEACPPMSHASASNSLSDIEKLFKNAPCTDPLRVDYTPRFRCPFSCPANRLSQRLAHQCRMPLRQMVRLT
jgi:hypothetical protein